jgi:diacylglycerol kinase (ATP)
MADSPSPTAPTPVYPKAEFKRLHVIINPAAGQDRPFLQAMNTAFSEAGIEWDIFLTKKLGDGKRLAQEAVKAGADVVAAYGGDGTVGEVATGLVGSDVPLAIIPGGTANVMSVELGIPADIPSAVSLICGNGVLRPVDMGQAGDSLFMLRATVGYSADMTKMTGREEKNRLGNLAYILSAVRLLPNMQSVPYKLTLDGEVVEMPGTICYVANSGSLGLPGVTLNAKMDISDGLIDVVLIAAERIGAILQVAASAAGLTELINHWQVREVTVEAEPSQTVEVDGEIVDPTPFTARVLPHAVRVVVPPPAPSANGGADTTS